MPSVLARYKTTSQYSFGYWALSKYGFIAVEAARELSNDKFETPRRAWQCAAKNAFPDSLSARNKACPRDAFLALCQMGVVLNVLPGNYTRSKKNKEYVENALDKLRKNPELSNDKRRLWELAVGTDQKAHNSQMDVLISLFRENLLLFD